ncbi:hypothetical protein [Glaciecola sp. KUL10]|uniref:hypothetical protein n=1 Tax=Glaciecola sp. (strain KUL10) TaxID=2161813 RepID=UPI000D78B43C|nr:hypothetical protein [Glaciecola sp. KUL10]GBL02936.1 hypothetical protein KUL10_02090 [Glaciecola sp. KUL10]
MAKQVKKTSFKVLRGIRINGESIFPAKGKAKPVVISIRESLALELQTANKGVIVDAKANKEIKEVNDEDAELDAIFGSEDSDGE